MFLTAELIFTIFMLAAEKHRATFIAPIGIGLALFIGHLIGEYTSISAGFNKADREEGVYYTGAGINPSRAFGPAVVNTSFPGYHWIYWLGPVFGALLASALYRVMKILEYETANPGQDFDSPHRNLLPVEPEAGNQVNSISHSSVELISGARDEEKGI